MKCPHCNLENPDNAIQCDCGHDFKTKLVMRPKSPSQKNSPTTLALATTFYLCITVFIIFYLIFQDHIVHSITPYFVISTVGLFHLFKRYFESRNKPKKL